MIIIGLDNGITLKTKNKISYFPWFVNYKYEDWNNEEGKSPELEILYYRKCWGIRGEINSLLHNTEQNGGIISIDSEDIPAIIKIIEKYLDRNYYDEHADSIWEYEEMFPHLIQDIKNLCWFKIWLSSNKNEVIECYWYDSY